MTFADALLFEQTKWPDLQLRGEFWKRDDMPADCRDSARPDPRRILSGQPRDIERHTRAVEAWAQRRRAWLAAAAAAEAKP